MQKDLTKQDTQALKGIAILLLLWHHCYYEGWYPQEVLSFFPFLELQVLNLAMFFKICVSLFAFVSGYGLYDSYMREQPMNSAVSRWCILRYIKSFSGFWFVVVLSWPVTQLLSGRPQEIYFQDGIINGIFYMVLDLGGFSQIFDTPSLQGVWWYMGAALSFIILTPLLSGGLKKLGSVCVLSLVILLPRCFGKYPGGTHFLSFVPAFLMGMIFAKEKIIGKLNSGLKDSKRKLLAVIVCICGSVVCYKLSAYLSRKYFWDITLGVMVGVYVITMYLTVLRMPGLSSVLRFLGKFSADIYLVHEFFRNDYCRDFIYGKGNFIFAPIRLLLCSLATALLIDGLKKWSRYNVMIGKLQHWVNLKKQ